jgi:hypothetical protein
MAANIFVFLFCCLLVGLLYGFPLRRAATRAQVGKLALAFASIGIFFLANALFAYGGRRALLTAIHTPPILSMAVLEDVETGAPVILDGLVSPEHPIRSENYVTYIECDDDACARYGPSELLIALDGGDAVISNDDFEDRAWPASADGVRFLASGDPVIVLGTTERGVVILGPEKGKETFSIRADIVYAGSHEDSVARARRNTVFPIVMLVANLIAVVAVVLLPWASWYLRSKDTTEAG